MYDGVLVDFFVVLEVENTNKDPEDRGDRMRKIASLVRDININAQVLQLHRRWNSSGEWDNEKNAVYIPHFRYDYRCNVNCTHARLDRGATRYFSFNLLTIVDRDRYKINDLLSRYVIESEVIKAEIELCGYGMTISVRTE